MDEGITWRSQQIPKTRSVFRLFGQEASEEPPTDCEIWNQQLFLGIIAKDGINLQNLLGQQPAVRKPQEPGYELPKKGETNV